MHSKLSFNTQPPEGGWYRRGAKSASVKMFQHTAARRRLDPKLIAAGVLQSFNTQPPEGGWEHIKDYLGDDLVSTHSRPKAAGSFPDTVFVRIEFQHTAARRRLVSY